MNRFQLSSVAAEVMRRTDLTNLVVNFAANFVEPAPQSQRDSIIQPRVDRSGLPWVTHPQNPSTLKGLKPNDQLLLHGVPTTSSVAHTEASRRRTWVRNCKNRR